MHCVWKCSDSFLLISTKDLSRQNIYVSQLLIIIIIIT